MILFLSSIHISEFTDTTQPQVNVRDDIMEVYPEINIGKSKHLPMMFLKSHSTGMIKISDLTSYITLNANFLTVIHLSYRSLFFDNKPVKIVSCGELVKAGTFDTDFYKNLGTHTNKVEEYGICFDAENRDLTISGGYATLNATFLSIYVNPCSLEDESKCADLATISDLWVKYVHLQPTDDLSNKHNPVSYVSFTNELIPINPDIYLLKDKVLRQAKIEDSSGLLSQNEKSKHFTSTIGGTPSTVWRNRSELHSKVDETGTSDKKPYIEICFTSGPVKTTISRSYKGVLETAGEIGGLVDLFKVGFVLLYMYHHKKASDTELISKIYGIKQADKPSKKWCKTKSGSVHQNTIEHAKVAPNNQYKICGDHILVSADDMVSAKSKLESRLDIIEMARELETVKFMLSTCFMQEDLVAMPTISWKCVKEKVHLGQLFKSSSRTTIDDHCQILGMDIMNGIAKICTVSGSDNRNDYQYGEKVEPKHNKARELGIVSSDGINPYPAPEGGQESLEKFIENWSQVYRRLALELLPVDADTKPKMQNLTVMRMPSNIPSSSTEKKSFGKRLKAPRLRSRKPTESKKS